MGALRTSDRRAFKAAAGIVAAAALGVLLLSVLTAGGTADTSSQRDHDGHRASTNTDAVPKVNHVFVLILENENADTSFGANSPAPYLAQTLPAKGAFLPNYYGTGHNSLDNYISMISGQGPNNQTQADCFIYSDFAPAIAAADGQYTGQGCVYPSQVKTVANQLEGKGLTWKGYMEDMASPGSDPAPSCRHPAVGAQDTTQSAEPSDQYATRHNPFVYFHSIIDTPSCAANDVDLSKLPADLKSAQKTASYSFITPDLCSDGHDSPCVDGRPGGLYSVDTFLREWVPKILGSPAYRDRGLLLVTFDEAEAGGAEGDSSSCCGEILSPNSTNNGFITPGLGGGRIGAVALSPCIKPGTVSQMPYNHYSQLRWVEQNFGLGLLGYAGSNGPTGLGSDVLNKPTCGQTAKVRSVKPAIARRNVKTRFTVRLKSEFSECRAGVTVKMRGKTAKTNQHGVAKLSVRFGSTGKKPVTARKSGCGTGRKKIRVKH